MKNFQQSGDIVDMTAPSGGVVSGGAYLIGSIFGVAKNDAAEAAMFPMQRKGVFEFAKATGAAWVEGDALYWDDTAKKLTKTAGDNRRVAVATAAAASGDTTGKAVLIPVAMVAPSAAVADLSAISGGESPTEAEHNALIADLAAIKAVLRAHNLLAD